MTDDRLGELYRAHGPDALRLAFVLTGNREVAEDVTQDAFVRIGRKIFGLRDVDHQRAYLRTVINLCRSRGRSLNRERAALTRLQRQKTQPEPRVDETWARLLSLPPRQRAALFFSHDVTDPNSLLAEGQPLHCSGIETMAPAAALAALKAEGFAVRIYLERTAASSEHVKRVPEGAVLQDVGAAPGSTNALLFVMTPDHPRYDEGYLGYVPPQHC